MVVVDVKFQSLVNAYKEILPVNGIDKYSFRTANDIDPSAPADITDVRLNDIKQLKLNQELIYIFGPITCSVLLITAILLSK